MKLLNAVHKSNQKLFALKKTNQIQEPLQTTRSEECHLWRYRMLY